MEEMFLFEELPDFDLLFALREKKLILGASGVWIRLGFGVSVVGEGAGLGGGLPGLRWLIDELLDYAFDFGCVVGGFSFVRGFLTQVILDERLSYD